MKCMRCGVETMGKQVFCDNCLASMEAYPVTPGTPVFLPERDEYIESRKIVKKKREPSPEEQIARLRRNNRRLTLSLIAALLAAVVLGVVLFMTLTHNEPSAPVARNYTTTEGA